MWHKATARGSRTNSAGIRSFEKRRGRAEPKINGCTAAEPHDHPKDHAMARAALGLIVAVLFLTGQPADAQRPAADEFVETGDDKIIQDAAVACSIMAAELYARSTTEAAEPIAVASFDKCDCLWRDSTERTAAKHGGTWRDWLPLAKQALYPILRVKVLDQRSRSQFEQGAQEALEQLVNSCQAARKLQPGPAPR